MLFSEGNKNMDYDRVLAVFSGNPSELEERLKELHVEERDMTLFASLVRRRSESVIGLFLSLPICSPAFALEIHYIENAMYRFLHDELQRESDRITSDLKWTYLSFRTREEKEKLFKLQM